MNGIILLLLMTQPQMSDYCSTPPFVANAVTPNVLIILDNSGSMLWAAYDNDGNASNIASGLNKPPLYANISCLFPCFWSPNIKNMKITFIYFV